MPLLALQPNGAGSATTIPCALIPVDGDYERFGDESPAWDGTQLTRHRARKVRWHLRTTFLPYAESTTLLAVLDGALPHAATGDLTGAATVITTVLRESVITAGDGSRMRSFDFTIREE